MTTTPAQAAIARLIDLAQNGEIDPWDVQVIEVIDRFLRELGMTGDTDSSLQEADLPQSGQAFLWASMLVLLKADTLESLQEAEEEAELAEAAVLLEDDGLRTLPVRLENLLRRRSAARPPRGRRVTLPELIEQIEQIAAELEQQPSRPRPQRPRPQSRQEALQAIAQLAHDENLTEIAAKLERFLCLDFPELSPGQTCLDLEELVDWWAKSDADREEKQPSSELASSGDRVGVFWALLLLSAQSKVELVQSEFYQDLSIQIL